MNTDLIDALRARLGPTRLLVGADVPERFMADAARRCLAEHAEPGGAELWAGVSLGGRGSGALGRAGGAADWASVRE